MKRQLTPGQWLTLLLAVIAAFVLLRPLAFNLFYQVTWQAEYDRLQMRVNAIHKCTIEFAERHDRHQMMLELSHGSDSASWPPEVVQEEMVISVAYVRQMIRLEQMEAQTLNSQLELFRLALQQGVELRYNHDLPLQTCTNELQSEAFDPEDLILTQQQ